jgi:Protein of unknown function (DUF2867)
MRPVEVDVNAEVRGLLPEADFADAFSLTIDDPTVDAITAAHRAIERPPGWISSLMRLRDAIVKPLGLRTGDDAALARMDRIGIFPVLSRTPERVVLGLDDKHLDFRLAVDVATLDARRREIVATTLVQTHNWLGRTYLALILPFHRRIVPALMARNAAGQG